jgi:polyphosphate kinase
MGNKKNKNKEKNKEKSKEKIKEKNMEKNKSCYRNRELSWLSFNERVLDEAGNPRVPLAERLTFASIYQSNLDEFYMVRVGTLMVQMHSDEVIRDNKTELTSKQQVSAILKKTKELETKKAKVYEQLMGELEPKGIRIINFNKLSVDEGSLLESYFDSHIAPFLSPMMVGKQQPFPFLNNKELYAIIILSAKNGKKTKIGIISCTNSVFKRLIEIPTRPGTFMLSEELILHFAAKMFPKYTVKEKSILRLTRNADIDAADVYDEDMDYRDIMEHLIKQRSRLSPVRLEHTREINKKTKAQLAEFFGMDISHIIKVDTPLDLSYVFLLQNVLRDKSELFYERRTPRITQNLPYKGSILEQIEKKDVLISYPFESMKPFLKMLHEAAEASDVVSIKMTLYRVADKSEVIDALIEAAENGKEVVVLVELRARFDEANNIEMSRRLEDAGCRIIYGLGQYKVHSKLLLITKNTPNGIEYITQIGTGNYNEKTARLYTDLSLITANPEIGEEANEVFKALMQGDTVKETKHLLVAPHCLQNKVLEMIDEQIRNARDGRGGYVGIKINSLTDKAIIDKLIEASCAGVKVEMIVRGICCLVPKVPGLTENITIVSVVGRFLEHSRIYRFGRGDEEKIYIASADFMTRNTLRRVEVAAPIYDRDVKNRIRHIFDTVMADDEKGREENSEGEYIVRTLHYPKLNSQEEFYNESYTAASRD